MDVWLLNGEGANALPVMLLRHRTPIRYGASPTATQIPRMQALSRPVHGAPGHVAVGARQTRRPGLPRRSPQTNPPVQSALVAQPTTQTPAIHN